MKKFRTREGVFVAEGPKVVEDLMEVMRPKRLIATNEWINNKQTGGIEIDIVTEEELARLSFLQHPQQVLAVFPILSNNQSEDYTKELKGKLTLALDSVQDPGNLGTIIRIADWFGIETIICSHETADVYNPKVVQATMGSIARVKVIYTDLQKTLKHLSESLPIYGTFLNGDNIYKSNLSNDGIIVMGNEGRGISKEVAKVITNRILIPNYPEGRKCADSLNVAIATAITCAEFRKRV
ncbi:RNA methyltransferase [Prevotella koreensis]|uniref:RNA methyltransferase n=2 Tax=Prevotella koreensis TaxID=2490854 RepID=A0A432LIQ7_9BACT|nr:RNA methyltransferase [Prevotella koreensis]RUL59052.1 RNA methyltransferase [Prevotella koreensis]